MTMTRLIFSALFGGAVLFSTGCTGLLGLSGDDLEDVLDEIEDALDDTYIAIQQQSQTSIIVPDTGGNLDVVLSQNVLVVDDPSADLAFVSLPNIVLLGFENLSGLDLFVVYRVDGVEQSIFVYDGETVLLSYPCFADFELIADYAYEPFSGAYFGLVEYQDFYFVNPTDFICGDYLLITYEPDRVIAEPLTIDLTSF